MSGFSVSLSGLRVAQRAIEIISTNITNAATEGFHRQEPIIRSVSFQSFQNSELGGARVTEIRRSINGLLDLEIMRQQTNLGEAEEKIDMLDMIEAAFGEIGNNDLATSLDQFFSSLTEFASDPNGQALRTQVVREADALAMQFNNIGRFLDNLEDQIIRRTNEYVTRMNSLSSEISELNGELASVSIRGGSGNILRDRREQAIRELSDLADVKVIGRTDSADPVNINIWGVPVVTNTNTMEIESKLTSATELGIGGIGSGNYRTQITGGKVGALVNLKNDFLASVRDSLDSLANEIMTAFNKLQIQGVGPAGSFTELTGVIVGSTAIQDWTNDVSAGKFYIRLTDTSTGQVTRNEINVALTDTVTDIRDRITAISGLTASVTGGVLKIQADSGYKFDFLAVLLPQPSTSAITGTAEVSVSGMYSGLANDTFTLTVVGDGDVGVDDSLLLEVRDSGGQLISTVNIGLGYGADESFDIGLGMKIALSAGSFNNGDAFTIDTLVDSDPTGFLAVAGMNTMFSGTSALTMSVRSEFFTDPQRLAASMSQGMTDSFNSSRMADLASQKFADLNGLSLQDYLRDLVTTVGQAKVVAELRKSSIGSVMSSLNAQWNEISGVNLNEEAAKLVVMQQMFQAVAKTIAAQNQAMETLMDLL